MIIAKQWKFRDQVITIQHCSTVSFKNTWRQDGEESASEAEAMAAARWGADVHAGITCRHRRNGQPVLKQSIFATDHRVTIQHGIRLTVQREGVVVVVVPDTYLVSLQSLQPLNTIILTLLLRLLIQKVDTPTNKLRFVIPVCLINEDIYLEEETRFTKAYSKPWPL